MPIYSYRCAVCGHEDDVLQKISDQALTTCPQCNASSFVKKITAAQFHLKGSGWYVTDFRGSENKKDGVSVGQPLSDDSSSKLKPKAQDVLKSASKNTNASSPDNKKEV